MPASARAPTLLATLATSCGWMLAASDARAAVTEPNDVSVFQIITATEYTETTLTAFFSDLGEGVQRGRCQ